MIVGIVAIAKNYAIGKGGKLPWHYPADLKHFKNVTTGTAVVMGARTWESIGRPLPDRQNVILSRSTEIEEQPNVMVVNTVSEALGIVLNLNLSTDVFIIGGAKTYKIFADLIEMWLVTEVPIEVEDADAFMPEDFLDGFEEGGTEDLGDGLIVKTFRRK